MRPEKLIIGLILTGIGLFLLYKGYQDMQPDIVEKGFNLLGEISRSMGEEMPVEYSRDKTAAYIMLVAGGILSILGINYILQSGKQNN